MITFSEAWSMPGSNSFTSICFLRQILRSPYSRCLHFMGEELKYRVSSVPAFYDTLSKWQSGLETKPHVIYALNNTVQHGKLSRTHNIEIIMQKSTHS